MMMIHSRPKRLFRPTAYLLAASLAVPVLLTGCGGKKDESSAPPVDDTRGGTVKPQQPAPQEQHTGMSTKKKVVILAGAALLYYLYKHHEKAKELAAGKEVQYYKSEKNGRVYYRDANHLAHYVTPPGKGLEVSVDDNEAQDYTKYKGYNNQPTGDDYGNRDSAGEANQ